MSTERDTERIVRSWLEDGRTTLPDWVRDGVLDRLPSTPQHRRSRWSVRRFAHMNVYAKVAVGVAAVAVVSVVGFSLLPGFGMIGGPAATPSPSVSPTPVPVFPSSGPVEGTYRMAGEPSILVTVPAGWESRDEGATIRKHVDEDTEVGFYLFSDSDIRVFADACLIDETHLPTGPTVADLLTALGDQGSSDVSEPVDVTIDGYVGTRVEISPSAGTDVAGCRLPGNLQIWSNAANTGNYLAGGPVIGPLVLVQTPTGRLVVGESVGPEASAADIAELDGIVSSIVIDE